MLSELSTQLIINTNHCTLYCMANRVFRAKFSSITGVDIRKAMKSLSIPNQHESMAVDARQELDLRMGVAFTRYQSKYFQGT